MRIAPATSLLHRALLADAVATGATGLLLAFGADLLAPLLALPVALLRPAGLVLLPFVAFVGWLGTRAEPARGAVWAVIGLNAIWVVDSLLLLPSGWVAPNTLGALFIVGQALVVAVFAELQWVGLRRGDIAAA